MMQQVERALDACSARLISWGSHRLDASDRDWLEALRAEMVEIDSAWDRLAWAAGGLQMVWGRHRGMRWVMTAGGLGGGRTYPWGLLLGIVLLVRASADWQTRNSTLTLMLGDQLSVVLPSFVQLLLVATFVLAGAAGYLAARRSGTILDGVLVGGLTGALGVAVAVVGRLAAGVLGLVGAYDLAFDMVMVIPVGIGATSTGLAAGTICGALAAPRSVIRAARAAHAHE